MRLKDVFVENLRKYRRDRGISQMTLAERCGTSTSYIGQMEIGNRVPSLEMIEKIAESLQISPYLLFFREDEDTGKRPLRAKKSVITDAAEDELIKRLTSAMRKVVKQVKRGR
jgi:transcriptional regulator with XRE-family HTH domain